jgi:hypothetical protein
VPDLSGVQEQATRKVGPLPLWGWFVAVGGAVLVYRMVRGGGTPQPIVTPGPSTGDGEPTAGDTAGNGSTGNPSTTPQTAENLPPPVAYTGLLTQLTTKINERATTIVNIAKETTNLGNVKQDYADKRISKATYEHRIKVYTDRIAALKAQLATLNKAITDIQAKLGLQGKPA